VNAAQRKDYLVGRRPRQKEERGGWTKKKSAQRTNQALIINSNKKQNPLYNALKLSQPKDEKRAACIGRGGAMRRGGKTVGSEQQTKKTIGQAVQVKCLT